MGLSICKGFKIPFVLLAIFLCSSAVIFNQLFLQACKTSTAPIGSEEPPIASSDSTIVSGLITQNSTWSLAGNPYIVSDSVTVVKGVKLTIKPGVIVKFDPFKPLIVKGTLDAQGDKESRITFTLRGTFNPLKWNLWSGIIFAGSSMGSILRYCTVQSCYDHAIVIEDCSPTISHCSIGHVDTNAETGPVAVSCRGKSSPLFEYNFIAVISGWRAVGINCIPPANPKVSSNNIKCSEPNYAVRGGGFLIGNYLEAYDGSVDTTLGEPADQVGNGVCNTTSAFRIPLFWNVDGVTNPRSSPNALDP